MLGVGDRVRWMRPLDNDYYYGEIIGIRGGYATITGIGLYKGITAEVHFKYIERVAGGRNGGSGKRDTKLFPAKGKL